jgi:ElaB/YqjD/DUF883 family membrane-anchored ribosome-binding protein
MDNEPEVTREQMQETRTALSEKLETLEQQVVDTVQGATNAVAETVENVKDAVHETVENVKDTFNLQLQVKRHPWGMVAGSLALGYLGGYLLFRRGSARSKANGGSQPAPPDSPQITKQQNGAVKGHRSVEEASRKQPVQEVSQSPSEPGWLSGVNNLFGTEITKLKGLVIGTVLSVVRDMITQSVPEQTKPALAEVMDSITVKLGGEPIRGPVVKDGFCARGEERQERNSSEMRGPLGATRRQSQTTVGTVA